MPGNSEIEDIHFIQLNRKGGEGGSHAFTPENVSGVHFFPLLNFTYLDHKKSKSCGHQSWMPGEEVSARPGQVGYASHQPQAKNMDHHSQSFKNVLQLLLLN